MLEFIISYKNGYENQYSYKVYGSIKDTCLLKWMENKIQYKAMYVHMFNQYSKTTSWLRPPSSLCQQVM